MHSFRIKFVVSAFTLIVLSLLPFGGCVKFRGERRLISSDKGALDILKAHEGVWIGRMQSQDDRDYKSEYIARVFRARNGQFRLYLNLFDPKGTQRIEEERFDVDVLQAGNGIVLFASHQIPGKPDVDAMVWFAQLDGRGGKIFFVAKPDAKTRGQREDVNAVELALRSDVDIANLKKEPLRFFDERIWIAVRFLDIGKFLRMPETNNTE